MNIPSPYYFVPLSDKIFFPPWAAQVSMDVPFRDGISGTIGVTVTSTTPIYIRNGGVDIKGKPGNKTIQEYNDFFRVIPKTGQYAINGTSLKGMIRSIVEIASFGKFRQVKTDRSFAFRELKGPNAHEYTTQLTTGSPHESKAKAGWLWERSDGSWEIEPQEFARVEIDDLVNIHPDYPDLYHRQTAKQKYDRWLKAKAPLKLKFDFLCDSASNSKQKITEHKHVCPCHGAKYYKFEKAVNLCKGSEAEGTIVFTGQPQHNYGKEPHKKHMEFIFYSCKSHPPPEPLSVSPEVRKAFIQLHSLPNGEPNNEWGYWKKRLGNGEAVPIFYLPKAKVVEPEHMGLALMFRLPCAHSIKKTIENVNPKHLDPYPLDLAETMFGHATGEVGLRGRIAVEPLLAQNDPQKEGKIVTSLNTPRPSYYPNYLRQDVNGAGTVKKYANYNKLDSKPRGWKKYPVAGDKQKTGQAPKPKPEMEVSFCPLPADTVFSGVIHLHNIRPEELGALVWALTWGGNAELRHNIGMAKPFGFGSVKVEINRACLESVTGDIIDIDKCQTSFTVLMEKWATDNCIPASWAGSSQIRELRAMANPKRHQKVASQLLEYPKLTDFAQFKKDNQVLRSYTEQTGEEEP